jgi:hypothetical protein
LVATNYCLLKATWELLCKSPFGDVFGEYTMGFEEALNQAIDEQADMVTEETEVAKFLSGLNELIASNPRLIQPKDNHELSPGNDTIGRPSKSIGKWVSEGVFLLPSETLAELEKARIFTQKPSVDSLTKALHAEGALVTSPDGTNGLDVSTGSTVSTENERNKILEDFQAKDESSKEIPKMVETMATVET